MNKKVGAIFIFKVKGGFNKAVDFIKNLSCSAFEWGKDLVMGIINDIELKEIEMYIDGYKANLGKDTSYKGLWTVSFTLKEL